MPIPICRPRRNTNRSASPCPIAFTTRRRAPRSTTVTSTNGWWLRTRVWRSCSMSTTRPRPALIRRHRWCSPRLARLTKTARLLILGNPVANRRQPVRVAEEMAMVDVLSKGRLECGFVRGVPYEVLPANSNPVRMNERQWEAMDLIVKAWTHHDGPFSHEGRFFHHRNVNIWPRCYQQPHPPIWVSTTTPGGAGRVGARGYVQATFLTGYRGTPAIYESYRKGWRDAGRGHEVPVDRLAYAALLYAAESEAEARAGAEKLLWYVTANKVPLHFCYPPGYVPTPVHAQILRGAAVDQHAANRANATVDKAIEAGIMFAGTPDQ